MNHSTPATELKPVEHINSLLDDFSRVAKVKTAPPKTRFLMKKNSKPMCFLLYKGTCVISRNEDGLVILKMTGPNIFGINQLLPPEINVTIESSSDIEYIQVTHEDFFSVVEKNQTWKQVSYVQMYAVSMLYEHLRNSYGLSTYKIISNLLYALNNEDFETRAMIPAAVYIQERTFLSRSGIMKILSALKAGGYIVIKRGLLIKINKLPENY
ncbi:MULTISPECIES: helix-turn-helix domain-containing protein [unclassified Enterobacter cloacae complex]|uniref:helix-turn-helix domain-containing protein n=1 Tax=unclassified Enterobacter cloacae complex TaxID=2757714 RepID=UPI00187324F2|nr:MULTISPECIES: helix-turn-helix domain-containing protein [unclassified Enterobacter cloacae complex]MBE4810068.1 helix-turn-helix domain-containing protein [Enterobacter cloacae complex sp. P44RS]MBE4827948.1 helix-turn-helix domain-containing protein [Enterobacter cloacae complex sp. P42RS]MBE4836254.1 helix-turn-helix domain-containing protein [Enterobacter cloacae complex sp. P46RS]MBE4839845.1 helix-turn-helix domain-containing protein [Enterobacter cloacae complex sp. P42C]